MSNLSIMLLRQVAYLLSGSTSGKGLQESTTRPFCSTFDRVRSSGQVSLCVRSSGQVSLCVRSSGQVSLCVRSSGQVSLCVRSCTRMFVCSTYWFVRSTIL